MKWLKKFLNKHPIILTLLLLALIGWFIWWMNQPLEVIYDPDGPLYWWDDDGYH
jgi:lipopolysaccharide export system protein LptC